MSLRTIAFTTTRADAILCGLLFDVSPHAQRAGFKAPVAMTRAAFTAAVAEDELEEVVRQAYYSLIILLPGSNELGSCSTTGTKYSFAFHREHGQALVTILLQRERF